jgi:hypothetical protein
VPYGPRSSFIGRAADAAGHVHHGLPPGLCPYWEKDASGTELPYLDGIVYTPIPDRVQRLNALKAGTVDIIDIPPR